jgi:hypothetical protein
LVLPPLPLAVEGLVANRATGITLGAPARLRGLFPAWRLSCPLHRRKSGRKILFSRSPQVAMIGG